MDCIVIGVNNVDFNGYAERQKVFSNNTGSFEEVLTNSVLVDGRYYTSIDFLNIILNKIEKGHHWNLDVFRTPSLAVFYLTTFLKRRGFEVEYINSFNNDKHKFKNYLKKEITCVAITTTFYVEDTPIIEIINYIREVNEDIKIIVGGPRCLDIYNSYNESKRNVIWNYIGADCYIIESQGEETLCKLVATLKKNKNADLSEIGNIVYKMQKDYTFTYANKENNCLDSEIINWDYFKSHDFVPSVYMRTSRGCCYACTYCTYPVFSGKYVCSDVSTIEKEMDILYSKGVKYITFIEPSVRVSQHTASIYDFFWL